MYRTDGEHRSELRGRRGRIPGIPAVALGLLLYVAFSGPDGLGPLPFTAPDLIAIAGVASAVVVLSLYLRRAASSPAEGRATRRQRVGHAGAREPPDSSEDLALPRLVSRRRQGAARERES